MSSSPFRSTRERRLSTTRHISRMRLYAARALQEAIAHASSLGKCALITVVVADGITLRAI